MAKYFSLYGLLRHLPFKEMVIPLKMLQGRWRNRTVIVPPFEPKRHGDGELVIHNGVPILRLSGKPYDIGFQHGALIGPHVRLLFENYLKIFAGRFRYDLVRARYMQRFIPPQYIEEMHGLAEGAGIRYEEVLVSTCFLDIHKVAACSTFVVRNGSSASGEIIMGRNLDFPSLSLAHNANLVVHVTPEHGTPFISVTWPGFIGCISGMNAAGLSLAMMLVYGHTRSDHLKGVPFGLHYRKVLEEAKTVGMAVERFRQREYAVCNNIMLADAVRDSATLELHTRSAGEIRDNSDFPVLACTNHFRTGHRRRTFAFTAFSSYPRLWRMKKAVKKHEPFTADGVKNVIARVAIPGINLQRIIFYPERREIEVAFGEPKAGPRNYTYLPKNVLWGAARKTGRVQ